jgi:23S rRNA pseudouridine2605 synthase
MRPQKPRTTKPRTRQQPKTAAAAERAQPERIQKILAQAGLASRREAEEWIRAGRVTVNGEVATLGARAAGSDQLRLDGRLIHRAPTKRTATWLCHRSPGEDLVTPREEGADESLGRGAVVDRLSRRVGRRYIAVSPMPRIDGGLELLTSDGALAARLQRAVRGMPVEFSLRVRGQLDAAQVAGILEGMLDSGERLQVTACEPGGGEGANRWYRITTVGANGRELRAMVERQGATVSRVLRTALGGLELDRSLGRGKVRQLDEGEIAGLLASPEVDAAFDSRSTDDPA